MVAPSLAVARDHARVLILSRGRPQENLAVEVRAAAAHPAFRDIDGLTPPIAYMVTVPVHYIPTSEITYFLGPDSTEVACELRDYRTKLGQPYGRGNRSNEIVFDPVLCQNSALLK